MPSILITGSNRGLGLEWTHQYAKLGWQVYSTCRDPNSADELHELSHHYSNIEIHTLDITNNNQVRKLQETLKEKSIDILLNNAGVYLERTQQSTLGYIDYDDWEETFRVNTLGAVRLSEAFVDQIKRSDKRLIVTITSHMGSISDIEFPGSYPYRSSKAALNAAMKGVSLELKQHNVGLLLLHPGWVKTRMGGQGALLTTSESVNGMRAIIDRFDISKTGHFYRYDGSEIPW